METGSTPTSNRDEKGRLLPGSTGNPNGRPKGTIEARERMRQIFTKEGFPALLAILRQPEHRDHFQAVKWAGEFGFGKPTMSVGNDPEREPLILVIPHPQGEIIT